MFSRLSECPYAWFYRSFISRILLLSGGLKMMKLPILFFVFCLLPAFPGNAQDVDNDEVSSFEEERRRFYLGFPINGIVKVNPGSSPAQGTTWFNREPAYLLDFSADLDPWHEWIVGFSFGFQRLANTKESQDFLPEAYLSGADLLSTRTFTMNKELRANTYSPMFYSEYNFVHWDHFILYARVETGLTVYGSNARISYKDILGHRQVPFSNRDAATSFNAGVGLGVKRENKLLGFKLGLIYQAQTKVRFRSQEEYLHYSYQFDASQYDFRGVPDDSKFTVLQAGDGTAHRYSPLYVQLGVYFFIGGYGE